MASNIPTEVVTHIMRFLNVSDRKEAALVCRSWYEASLDPILQRDIVIHFYGSSADGNFIKLGRRKMPHLMLDQFDSSLNAKSVILNSCQELSESLRSLSLKSSNITESTFVEILSNCTSLTSLNLSSCNSLFLSGRVLERNSDMQLLMKSLKNVKELNLSSIRHMSDAIFNRIVTVCTNLERLCMASSRITFNSDAYKPPSVSMFASSTLLTFNNVLDYIKLQSTKLKSLDLSRNSISDDSLESLVSADGLMLDELILEGCKELTDKGISVLCEKQNCLKHLDLKDCISLTDIGVSSITTHMVSLEYLNISKCRMVTSSSVKKLKNLARLQVIDLSDLYQITSASVELGLCENVSMPLTHVSLSCCSFVRDSFVTALCKNHPYIVHLDLGSCSQLTNQSVHDICKSMKDLQFLRLSWCKKITDLGILGFEAREGHGTLHEDHEEGGNCRCSRKYDSVTVFRKPTGSKGNDKNPSIGVIEASIMDDHQRYTISNLTKLRKLDLSVCSSLSDVGLTQTLKFRELRYLSLNMVPITDATVMSVTANNPSIEDLVLSMCAGITDDAIEKVAKRLNRLTSLDISGCDKLTDKSMYYIVSHCKRLKTLDVSFCRRISPKAVDVVEGGIKTLQSVHRRLVGGKS